MDNRTPLTAEEEAWLRSAVDIAGVMQDAWANERMARVLATLDREREAVAGLRANDIVAEDVAEAVCFVEAHDHLHEEPVCEAGLRVGDAAVKAHAARVSDDAATEAATRDASPEPLDVHRLARAIGGLTERIGIEFWREPIPGAASLIAAEYARLAAPTTPRPR